MKILKENKFDIEYNFNGDTSVTRMYEDEDHLENLVKFNNEFNQLMQSVDSNARGHLAETYWDFGAKEVWVTQIIEYTDSRGNKSSFQSLTPADHSAIDRNDYSFVAKKLQRYPSLYELSTEQLEALAATNNAKFGF